MVIVENRFFLKEKNEAVNDATTKVCGGGWVGKLDLETARHLCVDQYIWIEQTLTPVLQIQLPHMQSRLSIFTH